MGKLRPPMVRITGLHAVIDRLHELRQRGGVEIRLVDEAFRTRVNVRHELSEIVAEQPEFPACHGYIQICCRHGDRQVQLVDGAT